MSQQKNVIGDSLVKNIESTVRLMQTQVTSGEELLVQCYLSTSDPLDVEYILSLEGDLLAIQSKSDNGKTSVVFAPVNTLQKVVVKQKTDKKQIGFKPYDKSQSSDAVIENL